MKIDKEDIGNKQFISGSTILFVTMRAKVINWAKPESTTRVKIYAVYEDLTDEFLKIYCKFNSRKIPLTAIIEIKEIDHADIVDSLSFNCYHIKDADNGLGSGVRDVKYYSIEEEGGEAT